MNTDAAKFRKGRKPGEYRVPIRSLTTGRELYITLTKTQVGNPSARGGAYMDRWIAQFGFEKRFADTRGEAFAAILRYMTDVKGVRFEFIND